MGNAIYSVNAINLTFVLKNGNIEIYSVNMLLLIGIYPDIDTSPSIRHTRKMHATAQVAKVRPQMQLHTNEIYSVGSHYLPWGR